LLVALVVAIGAGHWLQARGLRVLAETAAERDALIGVQAMAEIVEGIGLEDAGQIQRALDEMVGRDVVVDDARVIRFKGIQLIASTVDSDSGDQAAPRKMSREEKPLYDLGQSLRQNVEANIGEGRSWKEEVDVSLGSTGALAIAVPIEQEGKVVGTVLADAGTAADPARPSWLLFLLTTIVPPLVVYAGGRFLGINRTMALVAALVLLVVALWIYGSTTLGVLAGERLASEESLAESLATRLGAARSVAAELAVEGAFAPDASGWDIDRFRSPRGLVSESGVDSARLSEVVAEERGAFWKLMVWPALFAVVLLGWIGLGGAAKTGETLVKYRRAYLYAFPAMAGMLLLVFFPFFYGIALSFTNSNVYNTDKSIPEIWIGFENYVEILTDLDLVKTTEEGRVWDYQNFYWTVGFTIVWTVTNVALGVSVGLFLALILNTKGLAFRPIYRVLLILPWAMPNYITALIWSGFFHSQFGVINQVIQMFGGSPISWFDTPFTSFITVLTTNAWLSFPFMMVISLGALQSIPADLYEAARVDGASGWQQFKKITLPSLKPALVPAVILSVVWTFNLFNVIYLVSGGEPGGATEILITDAYKIAFEQYRYGYAAAYSTVIFLILLTYGIWQNRVTRATEGI
jgi:arabinogalactan oligomer/maltooligosaccharide transport system permease protein